MPRPTIMWSPNRGTARGERFALDHACEAVPAPPLAALGHAPSLRRGAVGSRQPPGGDDANSSTYARRCLCENADQVASARAGGARHPGNTRGNRSSPTGHAIAEDEKYLQSDGFERMATSASSAWTHASERAVEEDQRIGRWGYAKVIDTSYDDPVVARRVLGDDLAIEPGERVW